MSEYQYYEFLAVDRPLTSKQRDYVSEFSSRAEVTSSRFVNVYNYGSFRGKPGSFLANYFDLMVYVANWGAQRFMLSVPIDLIDVDLALRCCGQKAVSQANGRAIIDLACDFEEGGEWSNEEGGGWIDALAPARAELLAGDHRLLYLGWLLRVLREEVGDDELEPFQPAGLAKLSPAFQMLVKFLKLDEDWIAAAISGLKIASRPARDFDAWVLALPPLEKERLLSAFVKADDPHLVTKLRRRFEAEDASPIGEAPVRTVAELRAAAEAVGVAREKAARGKDRR